MDELRELYQEVILDHNRNPRHFGRLSDANHRAEGFNPICGDRLSVYLQVDAQDRISDVRFDGQGCAISIASASLMAETLKGRTVQEAERLFARFRTMITDDKSPAPDALGKLQVLAGVREFPARVKCALLAWHTLHAALEDRREPVSTE